MPKTKKQISNAEAVAMMFDCISNSFSSRHEVRQEGEDFYITSPKGQFVLKTFSKELIKGSSEEVNKALEEMVLENQAQDLVTGFVFLRCVTDYEKRRNKGAFLKQSWDVDRKTKDKDHYNVKKLTNMERAVESFYDSGSDSNGYKSRVTYFNPKNGKIESIRFRENSSQHRISNTIGYACDWKCLRKLYKLGDEIDHKKCKTKKKCTMYARGREKREVRITELEPSLRMEVYRKGNLLLAQIR